MNRKSSNLIRLAAPLVALCMSGAALAQPRDSGSDEAQADCANAAAQQMSIEMAQCAGYPGGSTAYNDCQASAALHFSLAIAQCASSASVAEARGLASVSMPSRQAVGLIGISITGRPQYSGAHGSIVVPMAGFRRR